AKKGLLDKAKGNVLGMESIKDQSGDCDVEKNGKWSSIYAVGCQEYQMVCMRLNIASANVGMLDKFDHGLQTDVQEIWLKGLLTESKYKLRLVVGIAIGALVKGSSLSKVSAQVDVVAYRSDLLRTRFQDCRLKNPTSGIKSSALEVLPTNMEAQTKAELDKKAHSAVILCLGGGLIPRILPLGLQV
nr:zinc finger, CCHC-type [Tanacetum cinerariifolium]